MNYRIVFAVAGRARFLSHLETVDTLLAALRRAGFDIALSRGPKPRPVISLAVPRAVGVESAADLADVELVGEFEPDTVAERLGPQLPIGMSVVGVSEYHGKHAASRVRAVSYLAEVDSDVDWAAAIDLFAAAPEAMVTRVIPDKPDKHVNVKSSCASVAYRARPARIRARADRDGQCPSRGSCSSGRSHSRRDPNHQPPGAHRDFAARPAGRSN